MGHLFLTKAEFEDGFCYTVFIVAGSDIVSSFFGFRLCIGHSNTDARTAEHGQVVESITEEMSVCFSGTRSAEETAKIIAEKCEDDGVAKIIEQALRGEIG